MQKKFDAIWWIVLAAGAILAVNMGIRQSFGLFLKPITVDLHVNREIFAFAIALLNLLWGAGSPLPARSAISSAPNGWCWAAPRSMPRGSW